MISQICPHYRYILFQGQETYECDVQDKLLALQLENKKLNEIIDSYQPRIQKFKDVLQEIKAIAEELLEKGLEPQSVEHQLRLKGKRELASIILDLITKAEEE